MYKKFRITRFVFLFVILVYTFSCSKNSGDNNVNAGKENNQQQGSSSSDEEGVKPLVLGTFPQDKKEIAIKRFAALKIYLEEKLGRKINFVISPDYGKLARDLNDGKIDFASISPSTYVKKLEIYPNIKYVATAVDKTTGKEFYRGYIITHKNSGIKTFTHLKNKIFAFVDEGSGSGFKFPVAIMLNRYKKDPKTFFKKTFFIGNHPGVIDTVYKKQAHAGATWDFALNEAIKKIGHNPFRILVETPDIPLDTFVASPHLSDDVFVKLRKALVDINEKTTTKAGEYVTKDYYFKGYVVRKPEIYNIIRDTLKTLDIWRKKHGK